VKNATIKTPVANTRRSPNRSVKVPDIKPDAKRVIAKAETINPIAALFTPKDFAKTGIAGITIPKPTATKKEATMRIETSRGSPLKGEVIKRELPNLFGWKVVWFGLH
jgi:hypothetical protein